MPRNHDVEVVMGLVTDPSDAQKGLQELETSAEETARKTAKTTARAADSAAAQTEKASTKVKRQSRETGDTVAGEAEKAGKRTQRSAEETKDRVVAAFSAGQIAIGSLISAGVQKLTSALVDAGKQLITTGVQYNAEIEKYRTGLTNMLGSAEKANAALAAMQADAARTPFDTATLVKSNQYLISAGENAEYSRKTILALGDAVAATGGGSAELERMAQNLQQVANQGKATSVDIKQFAMAGINIYQVLADYTGKSVQDVQGMTITYDVLTQALQAAAEEGGRYYNSMATQSETLNGRLSTLKDNATQLAGALTEQLAEGLGVVVEKANDLTVAMKNGWDTDGLDGLLQAVRTTAPELSGLADIIQFCADNSQTLGVLLGMAAGALLTYNAAAGAAKLAQLALNAAMTANPIGIVIALLGALAGALGTAYVQSDTFRTKVNNAFHSVADTAKSALSSAISWLDQLSYKLNKALGKDGYTSYDSYEDWKADQPKNNPSRKQSTVTDADRQRRQALHDQRVQQAQTQTEAILSSLGGNAGGSGSSGTKTKKTGTEKVLSAITHNATTYSENELGTVTKSVETLNEKVKDASGQIKDRVTETTTETGKEMVDGVATTYTLVTKTVDGVTEKVTKSYADMSKVLTDTLRSTSATYKNGAAITTAEVTKIYADGSRHIETTATETGEHIVDGTAETYTKVTKYIDGVVDSTEEACEQIDKSVQATQKRIQGYASEMQSQLSTGIFGIGKNLISGLKKQDWSQVGLQVVKLIWGEVDQQQREAISEWAVKALKAVNEAYAGQGVKGVISSIKSLLTGGLTSDSIGEVKGIGTIIQGLKDSGGMGQIIGTVVSKIGSIGQAVGSVAAKVGSLIAANPEVFAVLAIAAGVIGLGAWLWKRHGKGKGSTGAADSTSTVSSTPALAPAGNYVQSDTITAAELTRRTQAASAANQSRIAGTQSGTGTTTAQQLNASMHGSLTATFKVDGRELAQTTVPYMDEELAFQR